ncbi:MAG: hypothetical protein DSO07_12655 [Thermoproteota archaeon]|jgi:hypothetical protein|uniref:Uncharacterized protein n=1 Tax=Candidatus Methanodesulfokora washburnensis TaxID=2478471 RepID=A0A429GM42_9CREN|nr:hypothetical protein [Candidatus Methanodesulfokores washburnensis]RSN74925.1 hypothetical protein D6D85_07220 [Candidatus Methanodesulfokores washburnensis]TDA37451.1 MAG: hypothetical protein DSO07_12655 [Candidatus Korarchaeota archaeon]
MTVEVDIREIKEILSALNSKIDTLIENRETLSLMMLAERSLKEFLEKEPDIYSISDIKVRYQ